MADKRTRWIIEATSNIPDINKQLEQLISLQRTQNELTQQNTTSTALAIQRQREQIEQLVSAQSKATAGGKQQTDMIGALRKEYDLLSKTLSGIAQLAAGAWAVGQLKTYVQEVIKAKSANDGFVASMEQMLGSRLKAEELNAKLINIALKSPFNIDQLQEVTKKLQGMGVETEKLIPYINMLGDISAIVGAQKLPLIAKALTDVQSKHTLMAQEIKQFTDNGVPLYDLLAKSMQKPVEEIRKLATEHKITFTEVEKALMDATQKGGLYYGQMAAQSKQLAGQVSNLGDLYTQAKARIGDYFENGIRNGIKATGELITATIGSENAITRSITALKAALAAYISYRTVVLSVEAAKRANNVASVAELASIEAQTVATVGLTGVTGSLSTALNGLKVAFMANPFGFVAAAVTSLISLFYTYKAATIEVSEAQSIEAESLRKTNTEIANAIERVKGLTVGTAERKKATEELIAKYPELFKHLDAEAIGNAQLETALRRVNAQYREKIQLAVIDAKNASLLEKQIEVEKQRYDLLKDLREKYSSESKLYVDDSQFLAALERMDKAMSGVGTNSLGNRNLFGFDIMIAQARALESESKRVQTDITKNMNEQAGIRVKIDAAEQNQKLTALRRQLRDNEISLKEFTKEAAIITGEYVLSEKEKAIRAENERWDAVKKSLKKNTDEYKQAFEAHNEKLAEINGNTYKKIDKAKKSSLELSLENDLAELKSMQKTYEVKMQIINTEERLRIEQAKRIITNHNDLAARIESIERESNNKRGKLALEFANEQLKGLKAWLDEQVEQHQKKDGKINALREVEKLNWQKYMNDVAKLQERNADLEARNEEKRMEAKAYYRALIAKDEAKFWEDKEAAALKAYGKEQELIIAQYVAEKQQLEEQAKAIEGSVLKAKEYQEIREQILLLEGKITKTQQDRVETEEQYQARMKANFQNAKNTYYDMVVSYFEKANEMFIEQLGYTQEAISDLYDSMIKESKASWQEQLKNADLSLAEMNDLFKRYDKEQTELLANQQKYEALAANLTRISTLNKEAGEETGKFVSKLMDGKWVEAIIGGIMSILKMRQRAREEQEKLDRLEREQEMQKLEEQKIRIQERLDFTLQKLDEQADREQAKYEADIQREKDKTAEIVKEIETRYAELSRLETQHYQAIADRATVNDQLRAELVNQAEARAIKSLETQRDAELLYAQISGATAEQLAQIKNDYEQLITNKHNEFAEARGNKEKEISIANKEVKAQETEAIVGLEGKKNDEIDKANQALNVVLDSLADGYAKVQEKLANAIVEARREAARQEYDVEKALFEARKAAALAEIEMALKKEGSKANPNGRVMIQLHIAADEIAAMSMPPFGWVGGAIDANLVPSAARPPVTPRQISQGGSPQIVPGGASPSSGSNGSPATDGNSTPGIINAGGEGAGETPNRPGRSGRFHGDTWVTRADRDPNAPYGIDQIATYLHEGERVMQSYLNQFLGPKVSNEELVHGYLQYANFADRLPDVSIPQIPQMVLPDFSIGAGASISMENIEKKLDELNRTFKNKPAVEINVDQNGVGISEIRNQQKINYYTHLNS